MDPGEIPSLFNVDTRTVLVLMFWGNLSLGVLMVAYPIEAVFRQTRRLLLVYGGAKFLQAASWMLLIYRGVVPDPLSVNVGNTLLFCGFFMESVVMLQIHEVKNRILYWIQGVVLASVLVAFNTIDILTGASSLRVAAASFGNVAILVSPTALYVFSPDSRRIKRIVGGFYLAFLAVMILRGAEAAAESAMSLFSGEPVQRATFILLNLMFVIGGVGLLLLFKEKADRELERMASTDALTGLFNRRRFLEDAVRVLAWHRRAELNLCLLFMDIDNFKAINDRYGHKVGDEVLVHVARVLRMQVRATDYCCRFGGEEFVVLLTVTDRKQGMLVANRILQGVREISLTMADPPCITISAGLHATIPVRGDTVETFIERSDEAMYQAKLAGKDRVICSE